MATEGWPWAEPLRCGLTTRPATIRIVLFIHVELSGETLQDRIDDTVDGAIPPQNEQLHYDHADRSGQADDAAASQAR
jgi:hypothetical protein